MAGPIKKEIENILSKQNPTGDDVGRLMILDLLSAYKNLGENGESNGILTDAEKAEAVNGLVLADEIQRFNDYRGLHDYLTSAPVITESYAKTYEVYRLKLMHLLIFMNHAEEERRFSKRRPVVMTEKQYEQFLQTNGSVPKNGIAVLKCPAENKSIDADGLYSEREPIYRQDYLAERILQKHSGFISEALNIMKDMLAECFARKKALELMASFTKLPQIKIIITPVDTESLELLNTFMINMAALPSRDDAIEQKRLQDELSALLIPIDLSLLEPTAAAVKKARRGLNFSVIKNNSEAFVASLKREWRNDFR